jgi:capsular exopolysaccharide synthesis family protein
MNDPAAQPRQDRSSARAHFHARVSRYKNLLLEKWWVLVLGAAGGAAIQGALVWYEPPSFASIGRMIVSIKLAIPEGSVYTEELSNFLGTQAALMQSGVVINRAHARVLAQKPEAGMHPVGLKVSVLPKTTIFVLQASGRDPDYTQAFLQACMEEYIALKREMRLQTSDTTVAGLTEEVMRLEKDLRKAEEDLAEFQSTNSAVFFREEVNYAGNYLEALNQRLAAQKSEYELLQMLTLDQDLARQREMGGVLPVANARSLDPSSSASQDGTGTRPAGDSTDQTAAAAGEQTDTDYFKAQQQLLLLKAELQELSRYLRPKHPKVIAMKEEIARREELLKIYRTQGEQQLQSRRERLALEIQILEKEVKEWNASTLAIQEKAEEYQRLKANSQRIEALYDRLLSTMQTLDVNKEISPESVTIMEKASPGFPDRTDLSKRVAIGCLAGLGLGIGLLFLLDRLDDRINSFTELQDSFDEDVLGQVPREVSGGSRKQPGLIEPEDARHAFVEAYRNLRSSLFYMAETGDRPRTILVTSSVPNEGKSITAANLAITMASAGSRVLLVDADLRKGALHDHFGLPAEPGLAQVLSQGVAWETTVQATKFSNLFVLPAGAFTANSSELFVGEATKRFLREAAGQYDYVILDTVPVMAADDVTSLAPQVDGVLFVIRAVFTSARVARASLESLYQRQVRVLGLVFNAVRQGSVDYYYYKYKDYYKGYPTAGTKPKRGQPRGKP